jgi:DNA-binding CsgD family transcriptional regulator
MNATTKATAPVCDLCGCALTREPLLILGPGAELFCSACAASEGELSQADTAALTTFGAYWWGDLASRAEELADHYLYRQPFYAPLYARFARELDGGKDDIALSARYVEVLLQESGDPPVSVAEILRGDFTAEPVRLTLSVCPLCGALASDLSHHDALQHGATRIKSGSRGTQARHGVSLFQREGWHGRSYHDEWANRAAGHYYATLVAAWSAARHLYGDGPPARTVARLEYLDTLYPGFERQPLPPPVTEHTHYSHTLSGYRAEVRQRDRYGLSLVPWEWGDDDDKNPRRDGDDEGGFTATDNAPADDWSGPAEEVLSRAGVAALWSRLNDRERRFAVLASAGFQNSEIDTRLDRQPGWARQTRRRLADKLGQRRELLRVAELTVDATARRWADVELRPEATFTLEPGHGRAACGVQGPNIRLRQPKHEPPEEPVMAGVRCECGAEAETFADLDVHACPLPGWRQWSRAFRRRYPERSRPGGQRTARRRELRALGFEPASESALDRRDKFVVTFSPQTVS